MIPAPRRAWHDDQPPYTAATLAAAIAGDRDAFAELWRAHHGDVRSFVYRRVYSSTLAEDITSETFTRALRRIGTFGEAVGGGMGGWLITIARNLIADHYKSSRTRLEFSAGEMYDGDQHTAGPEAGVLNLIDSIALRQMLARLTDLQRECIELRFLRELTVAETAQAMGKNEAAIKTLQYRAVRTLGRLIATDPALANTGAR
jgi:RNA polymerase sigma-70 factor (ECF subfamily)